MNNEKILTVLIYFIRINNIEFIYRLTDSKCMSNFRNHTLKYSFYNKFIIIETD